jgi:hypothetical protein
VLHEFGEEKWQELAAVQFKHDVLQGHGVLSVEFLRQSDSLK